jgi:hypothetical protein
MWQFVIVELGEALDGARALAEGPAPLQGEAFFINGPKEPFHCAVPVWPTRPQQMMHDPRLWHACSNRIRRDNAAHNAS